jgi:hypothetical protein
MSELRGMSCLGLAVDGSAVAEFSLTGADLAYVHVDLGEAIDSGALGTSAPLIAADVPARLTLA